VCRSGQLGGRNLALERLVSVWHRGELFACQNRRAGCKVRGFLPKVEKHEPSCFYREVSKSPFFSLPAARRQLINTGSSLFRCLALPFIAITAAAVQWRLCLAPGKARLQKS